MIEIPFLLVEGAFAALWLLLRAAVWIRKRKIDWRREAVLLLMYVNLAVILRFTFFPMALSAGHVRPLLFSAASIWPFRLNLIPFVRLADYAYRRDLLVNTIGNAALFVPSGIILPIVYRRLDSFWKVVAAGVCISLCIELLQLPFAVRATDVDDLIFNTLGTAVGWGIGAAFRKVRDKRK